MTIKDIAEKLDLKVLAGEDKLGREVDAGYCCDLLSWVMAHGPHNGIWITVQTHTNIIAVATLLDIACIIIPENISVNEKTVEKAKQEEIVLLSSSASSYELAGKLYCLGIGASAEA
jgi:serine kinase of HPr protein (carbohydrate metabolism regulator)